MPGGLCPCPGTICCIINLYKMRRLRFIPACLVFFLASCNGQLTEMQPGTAPGETGQVRISLSADSANENVSVKSASEEEIPLDDFWVEIFNSGRKRIYCEKYEVAKNDVINLNTGSYRLLAKYGDSLGVGFNRPFYMGDERFDVTAMRDNSASAVAKLSNVKAKVVFGDNITNTEFYVDCYALLRNTSPKVKSELKFTKTEYRAGYIPAGDLVLEVYAKIDGTYMYYPLEAKKYSPNDFVTFHIDSDLGDGTMKVSIRIDNTMDVVEKVIEIPAGNALPAKAPVITSKVFDNDGRYYIAEGADSSDPDLELNIDAQDAIKSLTVDIDSDYLSGLGIPARVDLMEVSGNVKALLESAGFVWFTNSSNTMGVVDFESLAVSVANNVGNSSEGSVIASFTVTVTDSSDRTASQTVKFIMAEGVRATIRVEDYNIWATKIVDPTAVFNNGNLGESTLEYSQDGSVWKSLGAPKSVSGNKAVFNTATGLIPGTECRFRVIYRENLSPRGEGTFVTEEAEQLGNSGMENWTTQTHNYQTKGLLSNSDEKRDWYRPWASQSDTWWDVNSKKTLATFTSQQYPEYKVVPTVSYSTDAAEGSYSAQIVSTFVCNMASDLDDGLGGAGNVGGWVTGMEVESFKAAGEMFIGKSDDDGNHNSEGHSFGSRPTSLAFKYKYDSYNNDTFHVYMYVADASGNIIAQKDMKLGQAASEWTQMTLDFDYTVLDEKAASIYICFRSSKLADSEIEYRRTKLSIAGTEKYHWI